MPHEALTFQLLAELDAQKEKMVKQLTLWANINSHSDNLQGLAKMLKVLEKSFFTLKGFSERIPLDPRPILSPLGKIVMQPQGEALHITKRSHAPIQVFLGGHMDTAYLLSHPFQSVNHVNENILQGPGVADMKGGLLIMLTALQVLENHPAAKNIGWEVLINPDEEIGSIGSEWLFRAAAQRNHLGLIFEPAFADGGLVSSRKGSMNFSVKAEGRAAHAGRDFDKGCNAILALAEYIIQASRLNDPDKGISINPGYIQGGGPVNIVPELAICRFNARAIHKVDFEHLQKNLTKLIENKGEGLTLHYHQESNRKPKIFDPKSAHLFEMINSCAKEQGYTLLHSPSGGVCDGNILAEEGMPVIDTLGAIGGNLHTADEYIYIDSLVKRSQLVGLFLIKLATGALNIKAF